MFLLLSFFKNWWCICSLSAWSIFCPFNFLLIIANDVSRIGTASKNIGIIRDVNLITVNENHFDVLDYGSLGVDINVSVNNKLGVVEAKPYIIGKGYIKLSIFNDKGDIINSVVGQRIEITDPHLWNGLEDPYLYTLSIELIINGKVVDENSSQAPARGRKE